MDISNFADINNSSLLIFLNQKLSKIPREQNDQINKWRKVLLKLDQMSS